MEGFDTPLYNAVKRYSQSGPTAFHMPGHKLGKGLLAEFKENMAACDLTEIPGTDNLHHPEDAIREAQEMAAAAFGARETFFLVNGSTCGVQSMILTLCKPGDSLLVSRDCHQSVINSLMLAGANPVYLQPEFHAGFGVSTALLPETVEKALDSCPDAAGVFITRPNYYGICADIEAIARVVHARGKILAVDEAHGAHLHFHQDLPISAMAAGADICVQSAHKTLCAMTQGAFLHVSSERVDMERLKFYLRSLQTSSPSYVIMASLDIARSRMEYSGKADLEHLFGITRSFRSRVSAIKGLRVLGETDLTNGSQDETRLVISVRNLDITGFRAEEILRQKENIQVEMADLYNVVCIATAADDSEDFGHLSEALTRMAAGFKNPVPLTDIYTTGLKIPAQKIPLAETRFCTGEKILFQEAVNRTSLAMVTPYPPGVPVVCPGEEISPEVAAYVLKVLASGGRVNGIGNDGEINVARKA